MSVVWSLLKSAPSRLLYELLSPLTEKLVNELVSRNAPLPILVTLLGIITLVNELEPLNAKAPMLVTLLSMLFLKEQVGAWRWAAVAIGFVGVLMVIQPRPGDIDVWAWVVLLATVLGAFRDVLGRYLPASVPTLVVSFASAAAVALVGCAWTFVEGWQPMTMREIGLLVASSLLLAAGYQFLVIALRSGAEFSVIGSFRYASILWALGIGYVVWGDVPNALALAGIAVIVGSGLYILHRERARR